VPDSEDIVSVCAGLVVIDQESALIRLVHYTTHDFFERTGNTWVPDSQLHIARTCLTYLCFDAFQSGSCTADKEYEKRLQEHQFLDYAAKYWGEHAREVEDDVADQVCTFLNSTSLSCAVQVLRVPIYKYRGYSKLYPTTTPLHELAHFGLATIAGQPVSAASGLLMSVVNARNSRGDTPLSIAAVQGHCRALNMLLDNEADVNAQSGHYGNALKAASYGGHEAVVKMLLENGADVNAQGGRYGNALQAASGQGHEAVVKMLLDKCADVNAQGGRHGNALQAASSGGYEVVVKMLLDKGADVNAQGGYYRNALYAASDGGHEAVVKILLDKGAAVNTQGGRYGNALQMASVRGDEAVVKMLLNKGADVNAQGREYGNALHAALDGGHDAVVKMLLVWGARSS
jgi:ankyrin repeat protein